MFFKNYRWLELFPLRRKLPIVLEILLSPTCQHFSMCEGKSSDCKQMFPLVSHRTTREGNLCFAGYAVLNCLVLMICLLWQVSPTDPIMLMANAVHEVHLTLRPHTSGSTRYMYVNVVGILCHSHSNSNRNSNKLVGGSSKISSKLAMWLLLWHCDHCPWPNWH